MMDHRGHPALAIKAALQPQGDAAQPARFPPEPHPQYLPQSPPNDAVIPSPIRIGAHDYAVKRYDRTLDSDPLGRCNYVKAEILIAEGFAPTQEVDIVLHEILHGITDSAGVGHDGSEQVSWEQAITTIASGLAQVMRDNPDLVRWAMRRLGAE